MAEVFMNCQKCGSDAISIPENATDESVITCTACGTELGLWGNLKSAAMDTAQETVKESLKNNLRDALKGIDGIKFE